MARRRSPAISCGFGTAHPPRSIGARPTGIRAKHREPGDSSCAHARTDARDRVVMASVASVVVADGARSGRRPPPRVRGAGGSLARARCVVSSRAIRDFTITGTTIVTAEPRADPLSPRDRAGRFATTAMNAGVRAGHVVPVGALASTRSHPPSLRGPAPPSRSGSSSRARARTYARGSG